jgi:hypothetical protein
LTAANNNFQMSKRSPDKSVPSMDIIVEAYIGLLHAAVPDFEEKVVRDMVRNFTGSIRPDNDDEETIYDEFALAYPIFGDPRSYYEET